MLPSEVFQSKPPIAVAYLTHSPDFAQWKYGVLPSEMRYKRRRERSLIGIFRQDDFGNLLPELVRLDFALLGVLSHAGSPRDINFLVEKM